MLSSAIRPAGTAARISRRNHQAQISKKRTLVSLSASRPRGKTLTGKTPVDFPVFPEFSVLPPPLW